MITAGKRNRPRVAFIGQMPRVSASGGRLVAIYWAEALARAGFPVDFFTDQVPAMRRELGGVQSFDWVPILNNLNLAERALRSSYDYVLVVPHTGNSLVLEKWIQVLAESKAKKLLLSFETPNWFNALSPVTREESDWSMWREMASGFGAVISLSEEGARWARDFYGSSVEVFTCYPCANLWMVEKSSKMAVPKKPRQLVVLSRNNPHKGLDQLRLLPHNELKGWTVSVFLGRGNLSVVQLLNLRRIFTRHKVRLRVGGPVYGLMKFRAIQESQILMFPTYFEGFGLPPVEAKLLNVPAVVSDLPVTRETGRGGFEFFQNQNSGSLHEAVANARSRNLAPSSANWFRELGSPERARKQLGKIFDEL